MPRNCNCAGPCGPQDDGEDDGVTRRAFLTLTVGAAGTAALMAGRRAEADSAEELARWKRELHKTGAARRYRSDVHTDVRFPLGAIGTGNVELGADGQLTTWQLFNTLRDGYVPFFFGVRAGGKALMLQTKGGPELPKIRRIDMTGEYPLARLRFLDADLPVAIEMTAFTPFAPLDANVSSLPVAVFAFRVRNPTATKQTISLAAFLQNPIGYDAAGPPISFNSIGFNTVEQRLVPEHPNFGGNVNEPLREGGATRTGRSWGLLLRAVPGSAPTLDRPLHLYTNANPAGLNAVAIDRPAELTVEGLDQLPARADWANAERVVIWLEAAPADLPERALVAARDAVRAGATLVFSGNDAPLLRAYEQATGGKPLAEAAIEPDIRFEDFEGGYERWTVEGTAFGDAPQTGTLPQQNPVTGFEGKGLVNSFVGGDDATGRLISRPFRIERGYIRFLVGGGSRPTTQIRLLVENKIARAQSGRDNERLEPALWDVRDLRGRQAHIEIVDEQTGPWGHINVDEIVFTDAPVARAALEALDELLPAAGAAEVTMEGGLRAVVRPVGRGKVVLARGAILDPAQAELIGARQRAYATLAALAGAVYRAPEGPLASAPGFGTLALATTGPGATTLPSFVDWKAAWEIFAREGRFAAAAPEPPTPRGERAGTPPGTTRNGAVAATVEIAPGETIEIPFLLAWHYPNRYSASGRAMGNHYATRWPDARAVLAEAVARYPELRERTERFHGSFYDSTLPRWLLDGLTAPISTLRHAGVVIRIADGDVYGWEGSNGCCQPTCTHVWGYAIAGSRLFPDLERIMRRIDLEHQQRPDGGVNNRTDVPSPPHPTGEQPFADGHASTILKCYREALLCADDGWLREHWPRIRKAVEYLLARDAATSGGIPDGTLEDDQWNTYDCAIHGVSTFIGSYYLAALRAGEEMARRMGEEATASRFRAVFERGQKKLVDSCWNGEYFEQRLPDYEQRGNEYGPGCLSDQLIGQWWAHQLGLGYLLPREMVQSALRAIFKYNWLTDHTNWRHEWRKFAGGKDKGLLVCTWPRGGRPARPILYCDEVWTGLEYQVAAHMVYEGMIEEALALVKGARDRYDGVPRPPIPRNPWNEIECGGHYVRALSSWSLLLALSGFEYDGPRGVLRFAPRWEPGNFEAFFCASEGWGNLRQTRRAQTQRSEITIAAGRVRVAHLHLEAQVDGVGPGQVRITHNGKMLPADVQVNDHAVRIALRAPLILEAGERLSAVVSFSGRNPFDQA